MSAIYMDGFDHYGEGDLGPGVANMLDGAWAQVDPNGGPLIPSFGARTGTYALANASADISANRYVLPTTETNLFMSLGFAVSSLPTSNFSNYVCSFNDSSNNSMAVLYVTSTGSLVLADTSGILAQTNGPVIVASNWHFLEMQFNQASGAFVLRVDDASGSNTPAINATSLSFASPVAQLLFVGVGVSSGFVSAWIDDLFIRNSSGSVNNGFQGDRRVFTSLVNADTTTAGWTPNFYMKLGAGILNNTANDACVGITTATSLNAGSGDFTLEGFVRFKSLPTGTNKSVIFGKWDETNNLRSYQLFLGSTGLNGGSLEFRTSTDGTNSTVATPIVYPWTPDLDTWYAIAVVRASGQDLLFVNGQQLGLPITDTATYFVGGAPAAIGGQVEVGNNPIANTELTGWFDEIRWTFGYARYTSNYTPTTIEYPRNVGGDPHFADVGLLCGFDSIIQDESSFNQGMAAIDGAVQQPVNDGPAVGDWSTIGKAVPDDNTFLSAPFVAATSILTVTVNPSNTNTVTVGTTDGSTPAVYTFKTALSTAFDVLIDTNIQNTLQNLYNAINAGPGAGTKYGTGTTSNFNVSATQLPAGQMMVTALTAGTGGNSIATSESGITGSWTGSTLAGGLNIPGPSNFTVQRLPPTTTIISAVQITARGFKSDAGLGSINSALIGPLGGVATGPTHALTVSPIYYNDIYETDPDTSGPISPTTIINGAIEINRDT
jgi:hypothetical protein